MKVKIVLTRNRGQIIVPFRNVFVPQCSNASDDLGGRGQDSALDSQPRLDQEDFGQRTKLASKELLSSGTKNEQSILNILFLINLENELSIMSDKLT